MRLLHATMNRVLIIVVFCAVLAACGGGTGGGKRPEVSGPLPLPLPPGHGLAAGEISVAAGQSMEHGNVVISCRAGGSACVLNVAADGSASYDGTGGIPMLRILPLMAGPGQNLSDASPVFATDETSTLKTTLANPDNVIPALATTVIRRREPNGTALGGAMFVKGIRRNADGEYVVEILFPDPDPDEVEEIEVTIPNSSDGCPNSCRFNNDGDELTFWSHTDDDDDPSFHDGLGEFEYLAAHEAQLTSDDAGPVIHSARTWFVFGVRNENLPMGTATYHGEFKTQSWKSTDRDSDLRQRIDGTMRIVANFDMRALEGHVYRIRGTPDADGARSTWGTSSFTLTNGRIVNGQFTATLTGVDSDPNTPNDESVRGFIGDVLAEFYGPMAEEVGGVVSATRDLAGTADDRVLQGHIAGRKTDRLTGVNDQEALSSGVDRDFGGDSTTLTAIEMPTVQATADGYRITYMLDGQAQTIELGESDFGIDPASSGSATRYEKEEDGLDYLLWDLTGAFERTRSFMGRFRPEHFDVIALSAIRRDAPGRDDPLRLVRRAYILYGNRATDMPTTGTARYAGRLRGYEWPTDRAVSTSDPSHKLYRGDLDLSANFANSAVTGSVTLLESRPNSPGGTYAPVSGGLSFNATISGNSLSATDLSGSGDLVGYSGGRVDGAFYGPGAAEVAGVFDATDGARSVALIGYFGGQKQ